jgi:hypothetical protein
MMPDLKLPLSKVLLSGTEIVADTVLHLFPNILNLFHILAFSWPFQQFSL